MVTLRAINTRSTKPVDFAFLEEKVSNLQKEIFLNVWRYFASKNYDIQMIWRIKDCNAWKIIALSKAADETCFEDSNFLKCITQKFGLLSV